MEWEKAFSSPSRSVTEPTVTVTNKVVPVRIYEISDSIKIQFDQYEVRLCYNNDYCFEFTREEFDEFLNIFLIHIHNGWADIHADIGENNIDYWFEEESRDMTISNQSESILCLNSAEILLIKSHVHELYDLNRDI